MNGDTSGKKPFPIRPALFLLLAVITLAIVWYGYYTYTTTVKKAQQADQVILNAKNYETLNQEIEKESRRCQGFIAQEQGEFGEFEYCKRFINWTNATTQALESTPQTN